MSCVCFKNKERICLYLFILLYVYDWIGAKEKVRRQVWILTWHYCLVQWNVGDNIYYSKRLWQTDSNVVVMLCPAVSCVLCIIVKWARSDVFPNGGRFVLPVKVGVSLTPLTAPLAWTAATRHYPQSHVAWLQITAVQTQRQIFPLWFQFFLLCKYAIQHFSHSISSQ